MSNKLKDLLIQAKDGDYALGHFNFSEVTALKAIIAACESLRSPVFVGTSEGEAGFLGHTRAVGLVAKWKDDLDLPIYLNADHHKTLESAKAAIDAGYDSVQIDEMALSFEENIKLSKQIVDYAKEKNPDISVEGGIGYIRGSSDLHKERIEIKPEDMTSPEEAVRFVKETGVDRLAIVIGNIHGISLKGNPKLNLERLKEIHEAVPGVPLTLHGGSGISDEDIAASLSLGMSNIHVNTELRVAFHDALVGTLKRDPDQTTPYKFLGPSLDAVRRVVEKKLRLFGAVDII